MEFVWSLVYGIYYHYNEKGYGHGTGCSSFWVKAPCRLIVPYLGSNDLKALDYCCPRLWVRVKGHLDIRRYVRVGDI